VQADENGANHDEKEQNTKVYKIEEGGFTLVCLAGIKDIIREEVPTAVI